MNATLQSILALLAVAAATSWLLWRSLRKKDGPGCGGSCGCPGSKKPRG